MANAGETVQLPAGDKLFEMLKPLLSVLLFSERFYVFRIFQDLGMPITVCTTALPPLSTESEDLS